MVTVGYIKDDEHIMDMFWVLRQHEAINIITEDALFLMEACDERWQTIGEGDEVLAIDWYEANEELRRRKGKGVVSEDSSSLSGTYSSDDEDDEDESGANAFPGAGVHNDDDDDDMWDYEQHGFPLNLHVDEEFFDAYDHDNDEENNNGDDDDDDEMDDDE
ncbi:protein BFR2-like [Andrographis paniculata]|uniref:protein BFR2-like n=1 Tax=Andrographis paniculata TaxID=175694 RepID=UPI0021E86BB1|nr:protein BFR2-like [Andrographis paniculata]